MMSIRIRGWRTAASGVAVLALVWAMPIALNVIGRHGAAVADDSTNSITRR